MPSPVDLLVPDLMCDTVFDLPFDEFFEKGIKGVIFDIDNTLVSYETPDPTEEVKTLLFSLREKGFSVALVSNNSPERVARFNEPFGFFASPDAHKPLKRALRPALSAFGLDPKEVLMVGDQLLTDVLAARLWGLKTAVVQPIKKKENLFFRFKRVLEKPFVGIYRIRKKKEAKK